MTDKHKDALASYAFDKNKEISIFTKTFEDKET